MRIAEIYSSIQGEGNLTGTESIFVRTSGCNLRCGYCDTPYTSWNPEGDDLAVEEIVRTIGGFDAGHVVLTGGEPMLFSELIPLSSKLRQLGYHITVETAGTLYLPVTCDLMSISPKLSNSTPTPERAPTWYRRHEMARHAPEVIRRLVREYPYQFKFVIDQPTDCEEVEEYLVEFPEIIRTQVLLMPQGTDAASLASKAEWLEPLCVDSEFTFCARRHIQLFGLTRGT